MDKMIIILLISILLLSGCTRTIFIKETPGTDDLRFSVSDLTKGVVNDPSPVDFKNNTRSLSFDVNDEVYLDTQLPHDRASNSSLGYHFHFTPIDNGTGNISLCVEQTCTNIGDYFPNTEEFCINDTINQEQFKHKISPHYIYRNNLSYSAMCIIRLYRGQIDGGYSSGVIIHEFDIHYTRSRFGTVVH